MSQYDFTDVLKKMKYSSLRGIQEEVITSILDGRDTVALMATGGGKTLCYQLPAFVSDGWVLVISPLISLMEDQKYRANKIGIEAENVNGSMTIEAKKEILDKIFDNDKGILFLSPEIMQSDLILEYMKRLPPLFIVFDEAHCISTWGQDFRPEYAEVGKYINKIEKENNIHIPKLALTATAGPQTVSDIIRYSWMREPNVIRSGMERKNISININFIDSDHLLKTTILDEVKVALTQKKPIIIYCPRRTDCETFSLLLNNHHIDNAIHHSGIELKERKSNANKFMEGRIPVMVATLGFGMGIDKDNVFCVIHTEIPGTAEAWYQEIGRAGRNGEESFTIGHVYPGITKKIRMDNENRDSAYQHALHMAKTIFSGECRSKSLLKSFGENISDCGKCDNCRNQNDFTYIPSDDIINILECISNDEYKAIDEYDLDVLFTYGYIDYNIIGNKWGKMPTCIPTLTRKGLESLINRTLNETVLKPKFMELLQAPEDMTIMQKKRFDELYQNSRFGYLVNSDVLTFEECVIKAKKSPLQLLSKSKKETLESSNKKRTINFDY